MGVTISGMTGAGSIRHNNRSFSAANVDRSRTEQNIVFCNEDLKQVYHMVFDEALAAYNAKKTKTRDKIPDYYEHIRQSKQEKLFHEAIFQIGNMSDCGCRTQPPSAGVQYGAAHGRGNAPSPCRFYPCGNGAVKRTFYKGIYETGIEAAGVCRCRQKADRMGGVDGTGERSSDGDRPAARF